MENFSSKKNIGPESIMLKDSTFSFEKDGNDFWVVDPDENRKILKVEGWTGLMMWRMALTQKGFDEKVPTENKKIENWAGSFINTSRGLNIQDGKEFADKIWQSFCHITAKRLLPRNYKENLSKEFQRMSPEDLKHDLKSRKFPVVVQIGRDDSGGQYTPGMVHSFVVLGVDPKNPDLFICFEKMGARMPYRFVSLDLINYSWDRLINSHEAVKDNFNSGTLFYRIE